MLARPSDAGTRLREEKHSKGVWILVCIAAVSSLYLLLRPSNDDAVVRFWTFDVNHRDHYRENIAEWQAHQSFTVDLESLEYEALDQKLMSAFHAGLPVADVIEVEMRLAHKIWLGPIDSVGFTDLRERLEAEGYLRRIAKEAFAPWSVDDKVFGIPRDLNPVMLAYRADIVEAAGIDVSQLDTWDKFIEAMRPLVQDLDGDGSTDRYILNMPESSGSVLSTLIRQGGREYDDDNFPTLNDARNIRIFTALADWATGKDKVTSDVTPFQGNFFRLFSEGHFLCVVTPDWRTANYEREVPSLAGKIKLMPLPAWEPGGRRTSVWGGVMLGIPKTTQHFEEAWALAKELYLTPEAAEDHYRAHNIVSPNKEVWFRSFYDEPKPFFCNQPLGRLYLKLCDDLPPRSPSPYQQQMEFEVMTSFVKLRRIVQQKGLETTEQIEPYAREILNEAQRHLMDEISRNHFHSVKGKIFQK